MDSNALRSTQNEQARTDGLLAQLAAMGKLPEAATAFKTEAPALQTIVRSAWKNETEPLAFDEFCIALDGMSMFPRQVDAWDLSKTLRASHLFSPERTITEWLLIWGKGSGKDFLSAKFMCWLIYILHQFKDDPCTWMAAQKLPRGKKLDLAPGTSLDIVNVAPNEDLARDVFFKYIKKNFSSPFFKDYVMDPPVDRWKSGTDSIRFPAVNAYLYSRSSNSSGLDGFNLLAGILDEADAFFDSSERSNAAEIHSIFRTSGATRFGPFHSVFNISYPRVEDGYILRLEERARKSPHIFYVDKAGTSLVRPNFDMEAPHVLEEFEADPGEANAKYNCDPQPALRVFFQQSEKVKECIDDARPRCAEVVEIPELEVTLNNGKIAKYVAAAVESVKRVPGNNYFLTVDGGLTGDQYVVVVGHTETGDDAAEWLCMNCGRDPEVRGQGRYRRLELAEPTAQEIRCGICFGSPYELSPIGGNRYWWKREAQKGASQITIKGQHFSLPHVYEDLIIEVRPKRSMRAGVPTLPVNFPAMQTLCRDLVVGLSVVQARTDPWQTVQMVQALQAETGVDIAPLPFSAQQQLIRALLAKIYLNAHMISLRPNELRDKEWRQLMRKGNGVDHPEGGSKDIYDAESMMIYAAATFSCAGLDVFLAANLGAT